MAWKNKIKTAAALSMILTVGLGGAAGGIRTVLAAAPETVSSGEEAASVRMPDLTGASFQGTVSSGEDAQGTGNSSPVEITAPIYNYDVLDVIVPASYSVAFNPYGLKISTGEGGTSDAQVISQNYGIVNKSTRDKLVTVTLTIEDLNGEQITFVDSAQEALQAEEGVFAVYLALVPAGEGEIRADNQVIDKDITAEALAKVSMEKSPDHGTALKSGENKVSFILSGANYDFLGGEEGTGSFEITGLAPDGRGVTAFTFDGVMNPRADWTNLAKGIRITVVYAYENTTGMETIVEGTEDMVSRE